MQTACGYQTYAIQNEFLIVKIENFILSDHIASITLPGFESDDKFGLSVLK